MARNLEFKATLRVYGTDLEVEAVSHQLAASPTKVTRGSDRIVWCLSSTLSDDRDLSEHVEHLLERVTDDLTVWRELSNRYEVDLFVGLFASNVSAGFRLSPACLGRLGDRAVSLDFDIYDLG